MTYRNIHEILATERRRLKLTQAELASRAGISRRSLIDIESGAHDVGYRKLERLLGVLGMRLTAMPAQHRPTESELSAFFKEDDDE